MFYLFKNKKKYFNYQPAILAGVVSILVCVFTANDPFEQPSELGKWQNQLFGLLCTLCVAILSGAITVSFKLINIRKIDKTFRVRC